MFDDEGRFIAGITNGLQFTNLTKHVANLSLGVIRQVLVTDFLQVIGNLNLHVVGNILVLLDALVLLGENLFILLFKQDLCHAKHSLHTFSKVDDFFLSLENGDFWRGHQSVVDILKTADALGLLRFVPDDPLYDALHLGYETDKQCGIDDVKAGVEHSQDHRQAVFLTRYAWGIAYKFTYHIGKRIEHTQNPDDSEHVEKQMGHRCPTCCSTCTKRCQIGCCCGSDILTHHQRNTEIYGQHSCRA